MLKAPGVGETGIVSFDGYDPETGLLQEARLWRDWPNIEENFSMDKVLKNAWRENAAAEMVARNVEWVVPTQEKADQLAEILNNEKFPHILIRVEPP